MIFCFESYYDIFYDLKASEQPSKPSKLYNFLNLLQLFLQQKNQLFLKSKTPALSSVTGSSYNSSSTPCPW